MEGKKTFEKNVIYQRKKESKAFAIPFRIDVEPMKRLLIANFKNDSEYEAIEPQLFDDEINGKGLRVLMYRTDKMVDVYHQKNVKINLDTFSIGDGIGLVRETTIEPNIFEIEQKGINLHISFVDKNNQIVEMKIKETTTSRKRINFLAPVGNDIKSPKQLFLAYMEEFDFVLRNKTTFSARVGGRELKPSQFPLSRNGEKVFFARYSNNPVIGTINPHMKSPLMFHSYESDLIEVDGMIVNLQNNRIYSISKKYSNKNISVEFPDGLINLYELENNIKIIIKWIYKIDNLVITGGELCLLKNGYKVNTLINVSKKWIPKNLPLTFQIFTFMVKSFRQWPTTYQWKGAVDILNNTIIDGKWIRK